MRDMGLRGRTLRAEQYPSSSFTGITKADFKTAAALQQLGDEGDDAWRDERAVDPLHCARIDAKPSGDLAHTGPAALAAAVSQANWRFALGGHDGIVVSAAFSPDGSRIVTASVDKTARIWDAASAKEIAVLRGHDDTVNSAAFSPDGSRIVTASDDKTARIWDAQLQAMSVKHLLEEACVHLAGVTKLTREEMRLAGYPDSMPGIDICTSGQ
jgi:WD40 repeat protein